MEAETKNIRWYKILLSISVVVNVVLGFDYLLHQLIAPPNRRGVLTTDVFVGEFMDSTVLFTLPKGLTVRDESPQFLAAAGHFEPYRFSIVLTTDNAGIVNYSIPDDSLQRFNEFYSIDSTPKNR